MAKTPWKIHEEFGILLEDLTRNDLNPLHQRPQNNWKVNRNPNSHRNSGRSQNGIEHKITVANGIFVQSGFSIRPDYRNAVLGIYKSSMENLDFANDLPAATRYINK